MSSVAQRLMTAEEFGLLPESDRRQELVRGEVIEVMPPGGAHSTIAGEIMRLLGNWSKTSGGGRAGVEGGFRLGHDPDTVRAPDVFYLRPERMPAEGIPKAFWLIAPDLVVEVISPDETLEKIRAKMRDYFSAGTRLMWLVFPDTKEVIAHTPDGLARTYGEDDILEHPDVLPGFSCKVAELFA